MSFLTTIFKSIIKGNVNQTISHLTDYEDISDMALLLHNESLCWNAQSVRDKFYKNQSSIGEDELMLLQKLVVVDSIIITKSKILDTIIAQMKLNNVFVGAIYKFM